MKGIILAAGRGSRMSGLTRDKPKCLVEMLGRPLLFWQLEALQKAGIDELAVAAGYRADMLEKLATRAPAPYAMVLNEQWADTNMLYTLFRAAEWAEGEECVISYSDILYPNAHVEALLAAREPVAITYDSRWEELWRLRQEDPLTDAETFREEGGLLKEIGEKPQTLDQVGGQFMGLIKFTPEGWKIAQERRREMGEAVNKTDMTTFIRGLLQQGTPVGAVRVDGRWCEVDTTRDVQIYESALAQGNWPHDWRF